MWITLVTSNPAVQTTPKGAFCWHGRQDHFGARNSVSIMGGANLEQKEQFRTSSGWCGSIQVLVNKGMKGASRRDPTKGGVLQGRNLLLPFQWERVCPIKTWRGSFVSSLESCISQVIQSLAVHSRFHIRIQSPPLTERSVMWGEHRWQVSACQRKERRSDTALDFGLLPSTSSVQFSWLFLENTSVPCKFECLLQNKAI